MRENEEKRRVRDLETVAAWSIVLLLAHFFWPGRLWMVLCAALLLAGLLLKRTISRMVDGWLRFSLFLSRLNSRVVLTLAFFLLLTPLAMIYRLFARNPLTLKRDPGAKSYFHDRNHIFGREDFEKLW